MYPLEDWTDAGCCGIELDPVVAVVVEKEVVSDAAAVAAVAAAELCAAGPVAVSIYAPIQRLILER